MAKYTTIRIKLETREKLKEIAKEENKSMCKLLEEIVTERREIDV